METLVKFWLIGLIFWRYLVGVVWASYVRVLSGVHRDISFFLFFLVS